MDILTALHTEYEQGGISPSKVAILAEHTPAHLRWMMEHPTDPSREMIVGTAVHALVLQPERVDEVLVVADRPPLGGKGVTNEIRDQRKAEWEALTQAAVEKRQTLIGAEDFEQARAMAARLVQLFALLAEENELAAAYVDGRLATEQRVGWVDGPSGVRCRGVIDAVADDLSFIADIKTVRDAGLDAIQREIAQRRYHVKTAMYADAIHGAMPADHPQSIVQGTRSGPRIWLPVVESEPPYEPRLVQLHAEAIEEGRAVYRRCLATWAAAQEEGAWQGHDIRPVDVGIPRWAYGR